MNLEIDDMDNGNYLVTYDGTPYDFLVKLNKYKRQLYSKGLTFKPILRIDETSIIVSITKG